MLENFFVEVRLDPNPIEVIEGTGYLWFNTIEVDYGFYNAPDKFGNTPLEKYTWNAEGNQGPVTRKTKDGSVTYNVDRPARDFLGVWTENQDELFTHEELNDMIYKIMLEG